MIHAAIVVTPSVKMVLSNFSGLEHNKKLSHSLRSLGRIHGCCVAYLVVIHNKVSLINNFLLKGNQGKLNAKNSEFLKKEKLVPYDARFRPIKSTNRRN